jgi:uncharacterized protein
LANRDKHGREFYAAIGRKGGSVVRDTMGLTFYQEIGRKGGNATKQRLGADFYAEIGRKGGSRRRGYRTGASAMAQNAQNAQEA